MAKETEIVFTPSLFRSDFETVVRFQSSDCFEIRPFEHEDKCERKISWGGGGGEGKVRGRGEGGTSQYN